MHATGLNRILLCKRAVLLLSSKLRSHVKQRQYWLLRCTGVHHARSEPSWYQSNYLGPCNPATPVPPRSTHRQPALLAGAFHQIVQNSRTKYRSHGGSKSTSHSMMVCCCRFFINIVIKYSYSYSYSFSSQDNDVLWTGKWSECRSLTCFH